MLFVFSTRWPCRAGEVFDLPFPGHRDGWRSDAVLPWVLGSGHPGEASDERARRHGRYSLGNFGSLACLSCRRVRESGGSLWMSGCPSSHDNDKRGGLRKEGSCWGLARGMESGHIQGLPRRRASARLQAVPLLCPELCSPSVSLTSAPCPRTPCNDKALGIDV